jgi:diguanylate cyclase (GGDEF)-like protein
MGAALHGGDSPQRIRLSLFDLDGFKRFNDEHGHLAGDALLARLAGRLMAAAGEHGRCYRLGGDEFCLLADAVTADTLTEAAVQALTDPAVGVGCSAGSVLVPDEALTVDEALDLADARMYAHKRTKPERRRSRHRRPPVATVRLLDSDGDRRALEAEPSEPPVHGTGNGGAETARDR